MPIGEGAVPTISNSIGGGAAPSHHHTHHAQHRTGSTIGSGATPSFPSFPTIGSGATPSSSPFTIGSGARPTTTTERRDPFADFNKPRTTSSLFPPRETRNDRSSTFTFGNNHHHSPTNTHSRHSNSVHVETGGGTAVLSSGMDDSTNGGFIAICLFVIFVIIGVVLLCVFLL